MRPNFQEAICPALEQRNSASAFDGSDSNSLREFFLQDEIDDEGGKHGNHQAREHQAEIRFVLRLQTDTRQAERQGFEGVGVEEHQAEQIFVPQAEEVENRDGHQAGFGERHHDPKKGAVFARPVHL